MTEKTKKTPKGRRRFLKAAVGGVAAASAAAVAGPVMSAHKDQPDDIEKSDIQYGMLIDIRRCIGCHSCTVACKSEFDVPLGAERSWVEYVEKGEYPHVGRSFLPRLCNHCSVPKCVPVCPTDATYKRKQDGIVVVDSGVCIGCKYCILACPYDTRFLNPVTRYADKCDFCVHRVGKGLVPSCVNTCIGGARVFGDLNDPNSEISSRIATSPVTILRAEAGTRPNVFYIGADHTDTYNTSPYRQYVRVETHRRREGRR